MRLTKDISERLWQLLEPVVVEAGFELVDITSRHENKRNILDIAIDKEQGITVDDCAAISEKVSLLLDVEDLIQSAYYLEVGSPGIFRELKKDRDFERNLGKRVKAKLVNPVHSQYQVIGVLESFKEDAFVISTENREVVVERINLKKIQLFPDL